MKDLPAGAETEPKKKKEDILQILVIGAVECVFKIQRESKRQMRRAPSGGPDLFPSR